MTKGALRGQQLVAMNELVWIDDAGLAESLRVSMIPLMLWVFTCVSGGVRLGKSSLLNRQLSLFGIKFTPDCSYSVTIDFFRKRVREGLRRF